MKKLILFILFTIFSMYYTNICISAYRESDSIMKRIKEKSINYEIEALDATIDGDNMTAGKYGVRVNIDKSYSKMKRYGKYNETLTVMEEVKPTISSEDIYNKYITGGNSINKNISLVFKIESSTDFIKILDAIDKKNIPVTFFIDGSLLEENKDILERLSLHEIELLSYKNQYDSNLFRSSLSYLKTLTDEDSKYCYTENENEKILNLCGDLKLQTVKPIVIENDLYNSMKRNLSNSAIISIRSTKSNLNELSYTIDYIISKGYDIVKLGTLLDENN